MIIRENTKEKTSNPEDVSKILYSIWKAEDEIDRDKEHFWTIGVNAKNMVKYIELVNLGGLNYSVVHPRETFRLAISRGVVSIIIAHNHPSADVTPSEDDIMLTSKLYAAGKILGIKVVDHVIIGGGKYYSFVEKGHKMGETAEPKEDAIGKSIQRSNSLHNMMIYPLIEMIRNLKKKELKRGEILKIKKRLKDVVLNGFLLLGVPPIALEECYRMTELHRDSISR